MSLLIIEFATAQGLQDPSLTLEGVAMLEGLISDLDYTNADYLISKNSSNIPTLQKSRSCHPLMIEEDLLEWLDDHIIDYHICLPVAPEENFSLFKVTKKIEEKGVQVIGSTSEAVMVCSDKMKTYDLLKKDHPMIKTEKVYFSNLKNYKSFFDQSRKMVVKPADGVSCSGVFVLKSYHQFLKASQEIRRITDIPYFLLQDYLEGVSTSVSLLSDGIKNVVLSLNLQNMNFNKPNISYTGGKVPFEHELSEEAKKTAQKAVKAVNGLKGYVGVDLILDDEVHLIEINPRITTPYIALRYMLNFNLGRAIIDSVNGVLPPNIILDGEITFNKEGKHIIIQKSDVNENRRI